MSWERYEKRDYLAPQDMPNPDGPNIVQIAGVDSLEKTFQGKTETVHVLRLAGWKRYLRLNNTRIQVLKALFGPEESSAFGRNITLQVQAVTTWGEVKPDVCIGMTHPPAHVPAIDQTGRPLHAGQIQGGGSANGAVIAPAHALPASFDRRPIGQERWDRFAQLLVSVGKTWDQFLRWCRQTHPDLLQHVSGVDFHEVPLGAAGVMKLFIDESMEQGRTDPKALPGITTAAALATPAHPVTQITTIPVSPQAQKADEPAPAGRVSNSIPFAKPQPRPRHPQDAQLDPNTDDIIVPF